MSYQLTSNQGNIKVSAETKPLLNEFLMQFQSDTNTVFASMTEFVFALIERYKTITEEISISTHDIKPLSEELQAKFADIRSTQFENEEISEIEMLDILVDIVNTPTEPIKIEVPVEVEKQLTENQILVELEPKQTEVLSKIQRYRTHHKIDNGPLTFDTIIKRMVFNEASLTNFGGCFKTGFNAKHLIR